MEGAYVEGAHCKSVICMSAVVDVAIQWKKLIELPCESHFGRSEGILSYESQIDLSRLIRS